MEYFWPDWFNKIFKVRGSSAAISSLLEKTFIYNHGKYMKRSFIAVVVLILFCGAGLSQASVKDEQPDKIEEGKEILNKWITARGGYERLSKIRQIQCTYQAKIIPQNLNLTADLFIKGIDKIRLDLNLPGLTTTLVVNGENDWVDRNGDVFNLPEQMHRELCLRVEQHEILLNPEQYNHVFTYEGRKATDNKEYILLKETAEDGLVITHYIDPETFIRRKYITISNGVTSEVIESDYRDVEGIKIPFSIKIIQNGADYATAAATEYRYYSNIDDSYFDRPEPEKIDFYGNRIWQENGKSAGPDLAVMDETIKKFMTKRNISAGAMAITYRGRLVLAKGYSWTEKKEETVEPESMFRIGSVSKPITAVAILHLVEEGKLRLDEKIVDVLNLAPVKGKTMDERLKNVTVSHLLQHLGGWDRNKSYDPMFQQDQRIAYDLGIELPIGTADIIKFMNGEPLQSEPGKAFAYSNYGYCLLGRVIEKRSGMPYETYVQKEILAPLGINSMKLGRSLLKDRAVGEVKGEKGTSGNPPYGGLLHMENVDASGGWIASAIDLVRFVTAFNVPEQCPVLTGTSIERMFALPENIAPGEYKRGDEYYSYGWFVRDYGDNNRDTWHSGGVGGGSSFMARWKSGINCAIVFNKMGSAYSIIDPVISQAVESINNWPAGDLFK